MECKFIIYTPYYTTSTNTATANYYVYLNIENNMFTYTNTGTPELILTIINKYSGKPVDNITGLDYVTVTDGNNNSISGFDITDKSGLITLVDNKVISASPKTVEQWDITLTLVNYNFDQNNNAGKALSAKLIIQKDSMSNTLADYVVSKYTGVQGENGLYHHDSTLTNGAGDNSYRYAGANPNNYVCFGSDDATCPTENLYRIIGLIDGKIKLISADGATTDMLGTNGGYYNTYSGTGWNSTYYKGSGDLTKIGVYYRNKTGKNAWSESLLNTVNLNTNFITYLDGKNAKWQNMIDDTTWYVGGMTETNGIESNARTTYDYEVGINKDANTTVTSKIGLMYVSEYYYGASPDYWTLPGYNSSRNDYSKAINDNWLYIGLYDWPLSRRSGVSDFAFVVGDDGSVDSDIANIDGGGAVRPSFNLTSSVKYESGDGTASSPIRLT